MKDILKGAFKASAAVCINVPFNLIFCIFTKCTTIIFKVINTKPVFFESDINQQIGRWCPINIF